ncbi:hypothetical protein DPEC_G00068160 [Dallia pectoralis]|uniref:Uncharacterized protein n=1 Tax=Dallia pectoralis TaxID=75939 RepID=A0ACC2H1I3_DALPE|nr:hypothetical protein DPEC_G00068160 [Dallia pectoralis]
MARLSSELPHAPESRCSCLRRARPSDCGNTQSFGFRPLCLLPTDNRVLKSIQTISETHVTRWDVDSWVCERIRQLAIARDCQRSSPALSLELLLYNALGSSSESAPTCLVRYLVNYSSNQVCEHIKTTLRNMITGLSLRDSCPRLLALEETQSSRLGVVGKAVTHLVSRPLAVHRERTGIGGRGRS